MRSLSTSSGSGTTSASRRPSGRFCLQNAANMSVAFICWGLFAYCCWVLASVIGWVSHLGKRVPMMGKVMAAEGWPSNEPIDDMLYWFWYTGIRGVVFMAPHSFFRVKQTENLVGKRFGRLCYSMVASITLHWFILQFRPLNSPVLVTMPMGEIPHALLSIGALSIAMVVFLLDDTTYAILGMNNALYKNPGPVPAKLDVITSMGISVFNFGGAMAFILFSGLSILPREVTQADVLIRVGAAMYLRLRSTGFRRWVGDIESLHHTTWILRLLLVVGGFMMQQVSYLSIAAYCLFGLGAVFMLNKAEKIHK